MKKVKIIATLGPSSDSEEGILKLAEEGVDIFRLNFSHYSTEQGLKALRRVRAVEKRLKRPFAVFGDLVGPKIRIGDTETGVELRQGETIRLVKEQVIGNAARISVNFPDIIDRLSRGAEIYLADGLIKLEVERISKGEVVALVRTGGKLRPRMGFSAHGLALSRFVLTPEDRRNARTMAEAGIDALAVSFIQRAADLDAVEKILPKDRRPMLIAKIETASALEHAEAILGKADAIMIARGDLGFSVPLAQLPHAQKMLIDLAIQRSKPVITATQMLESMIQNSFPTRAEVSDVANAILDGTDAVMLSGETAIGAFPLEVVRTMRRVIEGAVPHLVEKRLESEGVPDAVSSALVQMAEEVSAKLIITFTESGATAHRTARLRPHQPIVAISPNPETVRRLCFSWGVYPFIGKRAKYFLHLYEQAKKVARKNPIRSLKPGEPFVIGAGMRAGRTGETNIAAVERV